MLFNKSILAVAVMALANVAIAATNDVQTPACVLKVIGHTDNPGDTKAICGTDASKIKSEISKSCGDQADAGLKFFVNNCAKLGHKVESTSATETATGTSGAATATGSGSATASGFVTAASSGHAATQTGSSATPAGTSASGSGSGSSSSSGSGTKSAGGSSASPTFNAASSDRKFDVTTFAAAVFIGAAALI